MGRPAQEYIPYLVAGTLIWNLISSAITDGANLFVNAERYLKSAKLPYSVFLYSMVSRLMLIFCYQFVVYILITAYFGLITSVNWIATLISIFLITLNLCWIGLLCGMIGARFRDFIELAASALRIIFFVTPIIWFPDSFKESSLIVHANPFYNYIELFRKPVLGFDYLSAPWLEIAIYTTIGAVTTFLVFSRFRHRILYWV